MTFETIDDSAIRMVKLRRVSSRVTVVVLLALLVVWVLLPIYWIVITGLKPLGEVYLYPPSLIPRELHVRNVVDIFIERPFGFYLRNSAVVALTTVIVSSGLATLAGYAFAKIRFRGRGVWLMLILFTRTIPPASLIVPFYVLGRAVGIINTHFILVLAYIYLTLPLNVWISIGFFQQCPDELIDAAEIDGCTRISALFRVVMPSLMPALTAVAIITFMLAWNELLYGVVLINTKEAKTLSPGLTDFFGDFHIYWNHLSAAAVIAIVPAMLFTVFLSRYLISGLIRGAIKG